VAGNATGIDARIAVPARLVAGSGLAVVTATAPPKPRG